VETIMLVSDLIEDGRRIAEQLLQSGVEVTAAFWLKKSEDSLWYFYIVSPAADSPRAKDGYWRLHPVIRGLPPPHWFDPLEVRLIGPNNPIAKDVHANHNSNPGPKTDPINWGGRLLGNLSVDGAYLYPLRATVST
jgi:hypothetical protein